MVMFNLDDGGLGDGTVLLFGIQYRDYEGELNPKVFTYAALKAGERWYMTGTGQDAGWGAVRRWLADERRHVAWIQVVTEASTVFEASEVEPEGVARDGVPGGVLAGESG